MSGTLRPLASRARSPGVWPSRTLSRWRVPPKYAHQHRLLTRVKLEQLADGGPASPVAGMVQRWGRSAAEGSGGRWEGEAPAEPPVSYRRGGSPGREASERSVPLTRPPRL